MVVCCIVEMFGVVSIVPLVAVLTEPSLSETNRYLNLYQYLNFQSTNSFLIFLTSVVFFVTVVRNVFNGFLSHNLMRLYIYTVKESIIKYKTF